MRLVSKAIVLLLSPTSTTEIDNFEDEVDDFSSFFIDSVAYSGEKSSSESDTERSDCSSDSEFDSEKGETSGIIHESKMSNEDLVDDNIPLYKGARVSRLRAFVLVMLFTLRHQLSGRALIDLLKVLHALQPDGHRFVASAFLLSLWRTFAKETFLLWQLPWANTEPSNRMPQRKMSEIEEEN